MNEILRSSVSCLGIMVLMGIAIVAIVRAGKSVPHTKNSREMIVEMRSLPIDERIAVLNSESPHLRACAVAALSDNREPRVIDALIARLEDADSEVSAAALRVLSEIDTPRAVDAFLAKLNQDDTIAFRPSLLRRRFTYGSNGLVAWLIKQAQAGDAEVIPILGSYATPRAISYLIDLLSGWDVPMWDERRKEAAVTLAELFRNNRLDSAQKRMLESLNGTVWVNGRGFRRILVDESDSDAVTSVGMTMRDFIRMGTVVAGAQVNGAQREVATLPGN